jgi:hypothetical protein
MPKWYWSTRDTCCDVPQRSGRHRDGQQLRFPDFFRDRFTVGLQARDVSLDRLDRPRPALLDGPATGEAARQSRDSHEKPPSGSGSTTIVYVRIVIDPVTATLSGLPQPSRA